MLAKAKQEEKKRDKPTTQRENAEMQVKRTFLTLFLYPVQFFLSFAPAFALICHGLYLRHWCRVICVFVGINPSEKCRVSGGMVGKKDHVLGAFFSLCIGYVILLVSFL